MSLLTAASAESRSRGYEYFKRGRVLHIKRLENLRYQAAVSGSGQAPYEVVIDLEHVRRSSCTCPHAAGRRVVCKHMIAAFFAAFPEEAEHYAAEIQKAEEEWENEQEALTDKLLKYVYGLKKQQAQRLLLELLESGPEWQWERFLREHVE